MKVTCTTCKESYNTCCPHCGKGAKPFPAVLIFVFGIIFLLLVVAIVSIGYAL